MRRDWKVDTILGCWIWQGATSSKGYAVAKVDGRVVLMRRYVYDAYKGAIPEGHVLRSECRRRDCVNPAHMKPVPHDRSVSMPRARKARRSAPRTDARAR